MKNWMRDCQVRREITTVVKDENSEWSEVTGVLQGSVLAPIMFLIYVNNMPEKNKIN